MSQSVMQKAFTAGELAPSLTARTDIDKFHIGLARAYNMFVQAYGGAANRPGTAFVGRAKSGGSGNVRLIPFQFNTTQTYILEFGNLYMRVIMDGGYVLEPTKNITGITQANPGVITSAAHGFSNGDWVYPASIGGMTQLNGHTYKVANATTNTFTLTDLDGNAINTTSYGAYTSGGTVARVYTLTTTYADTDLSLVKFTQSADVMTLTHPSYTPSDLTRTQHWSWTLTSITFQPSISAPSGVAAVASSSGSTTYNYVVTAVTADGVTESLPSSSASVNSATMSTTSGAHVTVDGWTAITGAGKYRVYRQPEVIGSAPASGALFGYVGSTTGTSFIDQNIVPDFTNTPPQGQNPFASSNNPGVASYYEQRKTFGGSSNNPQTMWLTNVGDYTNMDTSDPSKDSDAITITINALEVNQIRHFVPLNSLLVLTSGAAWKVSAGSASDALTPSNTVVKPQVYSGASHVRPIVAGAEILYVQDKGQTILGLAYDYFTDTYQKTELSILSNHLFYGYQIIDACWAQVPYNVAYYVRNDGKILMFTFLKEQNVYGFTWGDSLGNSGTDTIQAIASVGEGQEDAVYWVVKRTIPGVNSGNPVQYVERMASRNFLTNGVGDVTKAWFVDCGSQYNGTPTTTITGLDYLNGCTVSILADGSVFPSQVVTNGQITLSRAASIVTVGLPYSATLQTLPLDVGEPTVQGKRKKISAVTLRLENTRGLAVGQAATALREIKETSATYSQAIPLKTGDERVLLDPLYDTQGSVIVQQNYPLPCTVLGIIPEITVGDR